MKDVEIHPETQALAVAEVLAAMRAENMEKWDWAFKRFGGFIAGVAFMTVLLVRCVSIVRRAEKDRRLQKPPSALLLRSILPPEMAEELAANFDHYYETVWLKRHSRRVARLIYIFQTCRAVYAQYKVELGSLLAYLIAR